MISTGTPCVEGITVNFVILNKVYEVIGWKVWKRNTEEEKLENTKPIKELFSEKEEEQWRKITGINLQNKKVSKR